MTDCIFCKIVSGKIPAKTIAETANSIAFLDAFPVAKGHTLVIPKKHYSKVQELPPDENSDLFGLVHDVASQVDMLTGASLIAIHNGKEAGQEIPHVHVHLVPRESGDSAGAIHSMFNGTISLTEDEQLELQNKLRL